MKTLNFLLKLKYKTPCISLIFSCTRNQYQHFLLANYLISKLTPPVEILDDWNLSEDFQFNT